MREKLRRIGLVILIILATLCGVTALRVYFRRIDAAAREMQNKSEVAYESKKGELNGKGFYVANFKDDLEKFMENRSPKSITYEFEGEKFYLDVLVDKTEEGEYKFEIERIANSDLNINARMNLKDVVSIEYRTDPVSRSSVLKINEEYNSDYFAMLDGTYYFLGQDIESISFIDEHFYYVSYNPEYRTLEEASSCSKEVRASIDGFNMKDYYYRYGKINFLADYYQKLASKTYTVQNKCDELEKKEEVEE